MVMVMVMMMIMIMESIVVADTRAAAVHKTIAMVIRRGGWAGCSGGARLLAITDRCEG